MTREAGRSLDPRVARSRELVLSTGGELLVEGGQAWVTIDRIAERSGVARTTIYRHWPSRSVLLLDAFKHLLHSSQRPQEAWAPGSPLRDRLIRQLEALARGLVESTWSPAVSGLIDAADRDPEMRDLMHDFLFGLMAGARAAIRDAVERGELVDAIDPEIAVDVLVGPVFYRRLVSREPLDGAFVEALVDRFLAGAEGPRR